MREETQQASSEQIHILKYLFTAKSAASYSRYHQPLPINREHNCSSWSLLQPQGSQSLTRFLLLETHNCYSLIVPTPELNKLRPTW
jgi:hypothetical protein